MNPANRPGKLGAIGWIKLAVLAAAIPPLLLWGATRNLRDHNPAKLTFTSAVLAAGVFMVVIAIAPFLKQHRQTVHTISFWRALTLLLGCGCILFAVEWLLAALLLLRSHPGGTGV